jgi:glycosyltransferase involved in cell wall biosynthesis
MAKQFQKKLGNDFVLGVNYKNVDDKSINIECFNTKKSYRLAWRYLKFIKKNHRHGGTSSVDHVYCREARLFFFIILFNKLFFRQKLKYIYEIHALLERGAVDLLVDRFLARTVDYFILITNKLREMYVEKYYLDINKAIMLPDGVDMEIFDISISKEEVRRKLDLPLDKKILVYTGKFKTMGMDKGISDILKAVKKLGSKEILFVAIGGSEDEIRHYSSLAQELSVNDQVRFIGLSPQSDLANYQKAADVLLMPFPKTKHYAYYMSPLKMFEYMASKRPIIATDLPSVKEVLNNGNAIIVRPDNSEDLADGIKKVLEEENLVNKITEQAFRDAGQYTWERRVERILDFIKSAR